MNAVMSVRNVGSADLTVFVSLVLGSGPMCPPLARSTQCAVATFVSTSGTHVSGFLGCGMQFFGSVFPRASSGSAFSGAAFFGSIYGSGSGLPNGAGDFVSIKSAISIATASARSSSGRGRFVG